MSNGRRNSIRSPIIHNRILLNYFNCISEAKIHYKNSNARITSICLDQFFDPFMHYGNNSCNKELSYRYYDIITLKQKFSKYKSERKSIGLSTRKNLIK
jgi:hypothetical protein